MLGNVGGEGASPCAGDSGNAGGVGWQSRLTETAHGRGGGAGAGARAAAARARARARAMGGSGSGEQGLVK